MRHLVEKSYTRNQLLWSEVKLRIKEEIPHEIFFMGTKFYESKEKLFADKEDGYKYTFKDINSVIRSPHIRSDDNEKELFTS